MTPEYSNNHLEQGDLIELPSFERKIVERVMRPSGVDPLVVFDSGVPRKAKHCKLVRKADGTWIDGHGPQANRLSDEDIAAHALKVIGGELAGNEYAYYCCINGAEYARDNHTGPQAPQTDSLGFETVQIDQPSYEIGYKAGYLSATKPEQTSEG